MSENKISLTINNKNYDVRINASILQACEENGIHLPRFCYHEKLSVAGNCRICLVEVEKSPKPVVSCAMPVVKGMVIYTNTPLVKKARESVLEFLLINHPLDCPICDQGGECDLQDESFEYGSDRGRFFDFKREVEDKEVGPIIKTIMTRCIHCTRCIRFSTEVAGLEVLGSFSRGETTEIGTYVEDFIKTELSGNLADICPVGALTSKPYAYRSRTWELQSVETLDFLDAVCTDIIIQTRKNTEIKYTSDFTSLETKAEILRILPRNNGLYLDNWISDKTRYAFDALRFQRIKDLKIKSDIRLNLEKLNIFHFIAEVRDALEGNMANKSPLINKEPLNIGIIAESLIDLESLYIMNEVLKLYGLSNIDYGNWKNSINYDLPNFYTLNKEISTLKDLTSVLLLGTNLRFEASLLNTSLRKYQLLKDLQYIHIGSYSNLKIKHSHLGLSMKSLFMLLENKTAFLRTLVQIKNSSIFLGVESLKSTQGLLLQTIARFLSKRLFIKTPKGERLGLIHSNTTSLVFNTLGVSSGVRSSLHVNEISDKKLDLLFAIQPFELNSKKWVSIAKSTPVFTFATHNSNHIFPDCLIPLKTLYEKDGFLVNIEGKIRKFYKSISAPKSVFTIESFFFGLLYANSLELTKLEWNTWTGKEPWVYELVLNVDLGFGRWIPLYSFMKKKWLKLISPLLKFAEEIALFKNLEKSNSLFNFYFFDFKESGFLTNSYPFAKTVRNFYHTDLLSLNSLTLSESSIFLNKSKNFYSNIF